MYKREIRNKRTNWQGGKWIRQPKRLAIMLRDALHCLYCGMGVEHGASLTLDHITPASYSTKAKNGANNLVTCCATCNSKRGNKTLYVWLCEEFGWERAGEVVLIVNHNRRKCIKKDLAFTKRLLKNQSITRYTGNAHKITR